MVESAKSVRAPSLIDQNICRVCLAHENVVSNIFEEQYLKNDSEYIPLGDKLYELLQIRYERSDFLPAGICNRCICMSKAFLSFRDNAQKIESDLQNRLLKFGTIFIDMGDQCTDFNEDQGISKQKEDCIVSEVNSSVDYPKSEEEFLMTDTEANANQSIGPSNDQSVIPPTTSAIVSLSIISDDSVPWAPKDKTAPPLAESPGTHTIPVEVFVESASMDKSSSSFGEPEPDKSNIVAATGSDFSTTDYASKNAFLCQYCDIAFTSKPECTAHESHHDRVQPYLCNFCPIRRSTRQNIIAHIKESHDSERPFICVLCSKGFGRRSDLKKHTIVHTGIRPFTCNVCLKSFSRNTNLTKHMRIHSSRKPHVCQRCPRSFQTAAELQRHIQMHLEVKPFPCNRCTASFTRRDKLVLHQRSHNRRDSEQLNHNKAMQSCMASSNTDLARHIVGVDTVLPSLNTYRKKQVVSPLSNIEESYRSSIIAAQLQLPTTSKTSPLLRSSYSRLRTCEFCKKTFTCKRDLQRHRALHMDKLFACKTCGEGFNRREKLCLHEQQHMISQYQCNICQKEFNNNLEFEDHMKLHEIQQVVSQTLFNVGTDTQVTMPKTLFAPSTSTISTPVQFREFQLPPVSELSYYKQIEPNINLGFYNETQSYESDDI